MARENETLEELVGEIESLKSRVEALEEREHPRRKEILTAEEAADYLRISLYTLGKIEKEGLLVPFRTPGGHRRYSIRMLNEYLERSRKEPKESS